MTGQAAESLIAARRRDSTRRRQRVLSALDQLTAAGQEISVSAIARAASPGDGSTAKTRSATSSTASRHSSHQPPAGLPRNAQPPTHSASGSTPPAPRTPACEPRTAPSATSSPATSASSGPSTTSTPQPSRDDPITALSRLRRRHVYAAEMPAHQALSTGDFR